MLQAATSDRRLMPSRPCIDCGTLSHRTRCPRHERIRQAERNARRVHYHGDYDTRAAHVRAAANADPATRCWRCGDLARVNDPWQAGHLRDGDPTSPLAPEHRSCNAAAGVRARTRGGRGS